MWDKDSTCKPIPIDDEKRSGHKVMIEAATSRSGQTSSFLIVNISNHVLGLNLNQPGISTYTPNYLYKDIFHRTISLQVIWCKVKVWAKVTKRQGGHFRIYCYGSKGPHQLVEVNPLYTCHKWAQQDARTSKQRQ